MPSDCHNKSAVHTDEFFCLFLKKSLSSSDLKLKFISKKERIKKNRD